MVRTPCFHCRGPRFNPWSGKLRSCKTRGMAKKNKSVKLDNLMNCEFHSQSDSFLIFRSKLSRNVKDTYEGNHKLAARNRKDLYTQRFLTGALWPPVDSLEIFWMVQLQGRGCAPASICIYKYREREKE